MLLAYYLAVFFFSLPYREALVMVSGRTAEGATEPMSLTTMMTTYSSDGKKKIVDYILENV